MGRGHGDTRRSQDVFQRCIACCLCPGVSEAHCAQLGLPFFKDLASCARMPWWTSGQSWRTGHCRHLFCWYLYSYTCKRWLQIVGRQRLKRSGMICSVLSLKRTIKMGKKLHSQIKSSLVYLQVLALWRVSWCFSLCIGNIFIFLIAGHEVSLFSASKFHVHYWLYYVNRRQHTHCALHLVFWRFIKKSKRKSTSRSHRWSPKARILYEIIPSLSHEIHGVASWNRPMIRWMLSRMP